jgi:PAS domain S-box-containing protein
MERLRTANVYEKLGFRFLDKKGKEHYVEATANFVKSLTGKGYNILMVSRDVTERRRAELELAKSYETTLDIIENAPFGIYLVNLKGDIDYVNPAMLAIAGDKYEEFTNMNVFRDLPGYEEIGLSEKIRSGLSGEYFEMRNVKYTSRYGSKTTVRNFTGIPIGDEADRKILMIIEDVTEIKRAEKELMDKSAIIDQSNRQLERKVDELQEAMKHIKRLEGLVPICMSCKKMRVEGVDPKDPGAWVPLERYISEKTNASLTHGLCPECAKKMYGEAVKEKDGGRA